MILQWLPQCEKAVEDGRSKTIHSHYSGRSGKNENSEEEEEEEW